MSTPADKPAPRQPSARVSAAQRYLFLFVLGLVVGVVATVMLMRALQARADHFPSSVMHVQQWHLDQLRTKVEQNRCEATDTLPHLRTLRVMADDLEPAFADLRDDRRFSAAASQMRRTLDASLASPPINCGTLGTATRDIGNTCRACHQDFRG
ncbi:MULTISPECIES: hypothetical protein [unclassified Luteimonas]|uniref:hypothetical protein n=1 Tax=Lysobacteraceae TaxID=32033 RepID=UPI00100A96BB|nr:MULTISPECIES: hypothetical protein [unclassified Luteimonas]MCD9046024.1 hypothetical protein [Luteimonas sp. MHLX1A]